MISCVSLGVNACLVAAQVGLAMSNRAIDQKVGKLFLQNDPNRARIVTLIQGKKLDNGWIVAAAVVLLIFNAQMFSLRHLMMPLIAWKLPVVLAVGSLYMLGRTWRQINSDAKEIALLSDTNSTPAQVQEIASRYSCCA